MVVNLYIYIYIYIYIYSDFSNTTLQIYQIYNKTLIFRIYYNIFKYNINYIWWLQYKMIIKLIKPNYNI